MKSLINLFLAMHADMCICTGATPDSRDVLYIMRRLEKEGLSFLTITLPTFASDLEAAVSRGSLNDPCLFVSFRKSAGSSIPAFLQGMMRQIFDDDGVLLVDSSVVAFAAIRQLCLFNKRITISCTSKRQKAAYREYRELDSGIPEEHDIEPTFIKEVGLVWNALFRYLGTCGNTRDRFLSDPETRSRCGSGETARKRKVLFAMALLIRDDVSIQRLLNSKLGSSFRLG